MPYKVAIRKNATGEIRMAEMEFDWFTDGGGDSLYWWTDGNFGCDCNRYLTWERAGGAEPEWDEGECGDTAFSALYAELPDGRRIQIDEPDPDSTNKNGS